MDRVTADPFAASPLSMPRLQLTPRQRTAFQVGITTTFLLALYGAYHATPRILKATPHTGIHDAPDVPGYIMLLVPLLALIPGIYVFLFLKYNWHAGKPTI